jgi:hypothetical protein
MLFYLCFCATTTTFMLKANTLQCTMKEKWLPRDDFEPRTFFSPPPQGITSPLGNKILPWGSKFAPRGLWADQKMEPKCRKKFSTFAARNVQNGINEKLISFVCTQDVSYAFHPLRCQKMSTSLDPTPVFHRTKHNSVQINTIFLNYKFTTLTPGLVSSVAVVEILVLEWICLRCWSSKHFWRKNLVKICLSPSYVDKVTYYKGRFLQDSTKPLFTAQNRSETS